MRSPRLPSPLNGEGEAVDRNQRKVVARWPLKVGGNFPMALDEANDRLFIGCRRPARLLVLNVTNGKQIGEATIPGDADDVFYDAKRNMIYISCGEGFIDLIDASSYAVRQRIPTESGARTSFFAPERNEFFLAVRAGMFSGRAAVRIYHCN